MSYTRALIDAEFHDTPIGRCVVIPFNTIEHLNEPSRHFSAGDLLAVVEGCVCDPGGIDPGHEVDYERSGFVRVVEVLPVFAKSDKHDLSCDHVCIHLDCTFLYHRKPGRRPYGGFGEFDDHVLDLPVSPGDVVLVVEPWCETCEGVGEEGPNMHEPLGWRCPDCAPTPVRVAHRDGVLGEVET